MTGEKCVIYWVFSNDKCGKHSDYKYGDWCISEEDRDATIRAINETHGQDAYVVEFRGEKFFAHADQKKKK